MIDFNLNMNLGKWLKDLLWTVRRGGRDGKLVADRFVRLFEMHGVSAARIPQLLPGLNYDALTSQDSLLSALTPDLLNAVAQLFFVQRGWLDGATDTILQRTWCYKHPERFFRHIEEMESPDEFPVRAFCTRDYLDAGLGGPQHVVLVLVERIAEMGEDDIHRYHVYGDGWDWTYDPARIQLKAMARVLDQKLSRPLPLYRVGQSVLERIRDGKLVPRQYLVGSPLTYPSLEDYALSPAESAQSRESEELPMVRQYIERTGLASAVPPKDVTHAALK